MISFIFLLGFAIFMTYIYFSEKTKERKQVEWLMKSQQVIHEFLPAMRLANQQFKKHLNLNGSYFTASKLKEWEINYQPVFSRVSHIMNQTLGLETEQKETFEMFCEFSISSKVRCEKFNQAFIRRELEQNKALFDSIEKHGLDAQQRQCVVTDEDHNLIIAGAGSGKTTTIVGKVKYAMQRYGVRPDEIALLSFGSEAAKDLKARVDESAIKVKTFHALGLEIIRKSEGRVPTIYDDKSKFSNDLETYFKESCNDTNYLKRFTNYLIYYQKVQHSDFDLTTFSDKIIFEKEGKGETYKLLEKQHTDKRVTYKRERVKSIEECIIANFLLFHGVQYQYEMPYEHETASKRYGQYLPDFSIFHGGQRYYLEHFGIDEKGNVPGFFATKPEDYEQAKKKYNDGIAWKRELHKTHGTVLIETFSYEKQKGKLLSGLKRKLEAIGIPVIAMTEQQKIDLINKAAPIEQTEFLKLLGNFLKHFKSNAITWEDLHKRISQQPHSLRKRNELFLSLFKPIYKQYQQHLLVNKMIDFSDMIQKAVSYIQNKTYRERYKYLIVDEFQDSSNGPYQLLEALKGNDPNCKLFCVGDDWQSIYRFAGSDLGLFTAFEERLGSAAISRIETTYRFKQPLIAITEKFIGQNPQQLKKKLKSKNIALKTKLSFLYSKEKDSDDTPEILAGFSAYLTEQLMENTISKLSTKQVKTKLEAGEFDPLLKKMIAQKKILILGRYTNDQKRIDFKNIDIISSGGGDSRYITGIKFGGFVFPCSYKTMHGSKGLQADLVIVLNCNSGKYGFPSEISDDPLMDLVLSSPELYPFAEERRLFYVALTRAKDTAICIAKYHSISRFLVEIDPNFKDGKKKCPLCHSGLLLEQKGRYGKFIGCSNFSNSCTFTDKIEKKKKTTRY